MPNTNFYRAPHEYAHDEKQFGLWAANRVEETILAEGPESVAAVFVEPVQNAGGCFPPPPGYFERLREICDAYDVLLVSDEVICAYGRLGTMFGAQKYDYLPDIITSAKGLTSGYSPLGAAIISDKIFEPFNHGTVAFPHGYTFGGHPVSCAVALANLDIFEREDLLGNVLRNENAFRQTLEKLWTCRSSATSAVTATSTASSWSRTRHQGAVRRRRVGADPARLRLRSAVRERPVLPRRRPRRPGGPGRPAADLRAGGVRRDGADAAVRAVGGREAALRWTHSRD